MKCSEFVASLHPQKSCDSGILMTRSLHSRNHKPRELDLLTVAQASEQRYGAQNPRLSSSKVPTWGSTDNNMKGIKTPSQPESG